MTGRSEKPTRRELIDPALKRAGWDVANPEQVGIEFPSDGFDPAAWKQLKKRLKEKGPDWDAKTPSGVCDYVLKQENGQIVSVVEAKKTSVNPALAQTQTEFCVREIEKIQGFRPFAFMTNGHEIQFWDVGEANIRTRLRFRPVEDNAEAHKMLGVKNLHWGKRKIQRTWRGMCYIMLRLEGKEPTTENIRNYQAEKLGRYGGNTLLTELMPIPRPKVHTWDYKELIPQFASREDYQRVVKPRRIEMLRGLFEEYKPRVVIGYGKAFWNDYRELFEGNEFKQEGQFQTAVFNDTLVILTGHFSARSMNGRFDDVVSTINQRAE